MSTHALRGLHSDAAPRNRLRRRTHAPYSTDEKIWRRGASFSNRADEFATLALRVPCFCPYWHAELRGNMPTWTPARPHAALRKANPQRPVFSQLPAIF